VEAAPALGLSTSTASTPRGSGGRGRASISEIISTVLPCDASTHRFYFELTLTHVTPTGRSNTAGPLDAAQLAVAQGTSPPIRGN